MVCRLILNSTLNRVDQLCKAHVIMFACIAQIPSVSDLSIYIFFFFPVSNENEEKSALRCVVLLFQGHLSMKFCWPEARVTAELHISFCLRLAGRMV